MNDISLKEGTVLHSPKRDYVVVKVLGRGGFGITYLVESEVQIDNILVTTRFAVKEHFIGTLSSRESDSQNVVSSQPVTDEVERSMKAFIAEANRLQKLGINHPNIVRVNEVFMANNTAYYVMEYLEGCSLVDYVKQHKRLTWDKVSELLHPVIDAVGVLHANNVAHYDIKPQNIMVVTTKGKDRAVLIDFGLAKHYDGKGKATSSIAAAGYTHGYAPVEQYGGITNFQPTADVYALTATMVFCLTGEAPERAQELDLEKLRATLTKLGLPADVCTKLLKGLEYRISDRPANAGKLASLLFDDEPGVTQRALGDKGGAKKKGDTAQPGATVAEIKPGSKTVKPKSTTPGKRPKWLIPAIAAGGVVIVAVALVLILSGPEEEPEQPIVAVVEQPVEPQPVEVVDTLPQEDSIVEEVEAEKPTQQTQEQQSNRRRNNVRQSELTAMHSQEPQTVEVERLTPEQMYQKGMQLLSSQPKEAASLLHDAAVQGHTKAMYQYGYCLEKGKGVTTNASEAFGWYRQAADKGYADAQYRVAWCYQKGKGIGISLTKAAEYYQLAAGQGHTEAQYEAGNCFYNGIGVKKDHKVAFRYFSDAATKGNINAINGLALCYEEGHGVKKDRNTALNYYLQTANKGNARGQWSVGRFYEKGWGGLEKNKTMALDWYRKAAAQGMAEAVNDMHRLERELNK
ncbi:MAG: protein kinase [Muribaculaceae bacterium]